MDLVERIASETKGDFEAGFGMSDGYALGYAVEPARSANGGFGVTLIGKVNGGLVSQRQTAFQGAAPDALFVSNCKYVAQQLGASLRAKADNK